MASAQALHTTIDRTGHLTVTNIPGVASIPDVPTTPRVMVSFNRRSDAGEERPLPGEELEAPAAPRPARTTGSHADVANALARNTAMTSPRSYSIDASEAARRLSQARQERARGAALLPGEHAVAPERGTGNNRYQWRLQKLDNRVEQAELRFSRTNR
jgi:hypothetical protein